MKSCLHRCCFRCFHFFSQRASGRHTWNPLQACGHAFACLACCSSAPRFYSDNANSKNVDSTSSDLFSHGFQSSNGATQEEGSLLYPGPLVRGSILEILLHEGERTNSLRLPGVAVGDVHGIIHVVSHLHCICRVSCYWTGQFKGTLGEEKERLEYVQSHLITRFLSHHLTN